MTYSEQSRRSPEAVAKPVHGALRQVGAQRPSERLAAHREVEAHLPGRGAEPRPATGCDPVCEELPVTCPGEPHERRLRAHRPATDAGAGGGGYAPGSGSTTGSGSASASPAASASASGSTSGAASTDASPSAALSSAPWPDASA
jgi:hypothetical protein